jgi:large subunit ribosomal protein L4
VLVVLDNTEEVVWKSFRNLGERVKLVLPRELNAYDVLVSDWVVFSRDSLDKAVAHFGGEKPEAVAQAQEEAEEPA